MKLKGHFKRRIIKGNYEPSIYIKRIERDVLKLIIKEYKPREIAQALEIKDKDVYNAIQRCKMKMKRQLRK